MVRCGGNDTIYFQIRLEFSEVVWKDWESAVCSSVCLLSLQGAFQGVFAVEITLSNH